MKLHRPYIPIPVRVAVAKRQVTLANPSPAPTLDALPGESGAWHLSRLLHALFGDAKIQLHHRPALCNRRKHMRRGKVRYEPPANSPEHLIYLPKGDHDIETRIRGVGALRSDLGELRYQKRVKRNRKRRRARRARRPVVRRRAPRPRPTAPVRTAHQRAPAGRQTGFGPKRSKWPSRPLRGGGRWPTRGGR